MSQGFVISNHESLVQAVKEMIAASLHGKRVVLTLSAFHEAICNEHPQKHEKALNHQEHALLLLHPLLPLSDVPRPY
jgi:hypothetical protein